MRVDVVKYLFVGAAEDKAAFFQKAQEAGIIEFIHPEGKRVSVYAGPLGTIAEAIKVLRKYVQEPQELKGDLVAEPIAHKILALKKELGELEDKRTATEQELHLTTPFGTFSLDDVRKTAESIGRRARFFMGKKIKHLAEQDARLILVNRIAGLEYFIAFSNDPFTHADLVEVFVTRSPAKAQKEYDKVVARHEEVVAELKHLTRYNTFLHHALVHMVNNVSLEHANDCARPEFDKQLFLVEGWVPQDKPAQVEALAQAHGILAEKVKPDELQVIPTCLENRGLGRVGEDLVTLFDTPSNKDKDPSLWVLFAFSLFFAMIVGDGGYGLVFLIAAIVAKYRLKHITQFGKRFITLSALIAASCFVWGGLIHSFFGISLAPDNPIRAHSLMTYLVEKKAAYHLQRKDATYAMWVKKFPQIAESKTPEQFLMLNDPSSPIFGKFADSILMELALFVGSVHIILGMLRYCGKHPTYFGWMAVIVGAYLYIPYYLDAPTLVNFVFDVPLIGGAQLGLNLVYTGVGLATIIAIARGGIFGIFECMTGIQIFADVLSYLRIYALGLAGAIVASVINELAIKLPILLAIVILLASHVLNVILSIMGGTIHGLRLNYLEWYHYAFEGGGRPFRPLHLKVIE